MEYYAGRGPGPQRGNRGIWSRVGNPMKLVECDLRSYASGSTKWRQVASEHNFDGWL